MTFSTKSLSLAAILAMGVSGSALAQVSATADVDAGATAGTSAGATAGADIGANAGTNAQSDNVTSNYGAADSTTSAETTLKRTPGTESDGSQANVTSNYGNEESNASAESALATTPNTESNGSQANVTSNYGEEADIASIDADTDMQMMGVTEAGEASANVYSEAELEDMRATVASNADLMTALEADGYTSDDVLGVYSQTDGSVHVIVDDRS